MGLRDKLKRYASQSQRSPNDSSSNSENSSRSSRTNKRSSSSSSQNTSMSSNISSVNPSSTSPVDNVGPSHGQSSSSARDVLPSYASLVPNSNSQLPVYQTTPKRLPSTSSVFSQMPDNERDLGDHFCNITPIHDPINISPEEFQRMADHNLKLVPAPNLILHPGAKHLTITSRFKGGEIRYVSASGGEKKDTTFVQTKKGTEDIYFKSDLPLYSPNLVKQRKFPMMYSSLASIPGSLPSVIYFEALITTKIGNPAYNNISIGFICQPYPEFRQPGWHPGSIAIHSENGNRYVNDSLAGKEFVGSFTQAGTIVGFGIDMKRMAAFFTRNGKWEKEWSLIEDLNSAPIHPERGFRDGGIEGFEGNKDIYAAVGMLGRTGVQVNLNGPFRYKGLI